MIKEQFLKDLIIKEYGYSVLDQISEMPYKDVKDYLLARMDEVKVDYDFEKLKDVTVWGSDLDTFKRRAYIYHSYMVNIIEHEFGDCLK